MVVTHHVSCLSGSCNFHFLSRGSFGEGTGSWAIGRRCSMNSCRKFGSFDHLTAVTTKVSSPMKIIAANSPTLPVGNCRLGLPQTEMALERFQKIQNICQPPPPCERK